VIGVTSSESFLVNRTVGILVEGAV